jgi:hypothetical protein
MKLSRTLFGLVFLIFLISIGPALACSCGGAPSQTLEDLVGSAMNTSIAVFEGKVVKFEHRKGIPNDFMETYPAANRPEYETTLVRFEVSRWWKGDLAREVLLSTAETRNSDGTASFSSCDFHFKEGGKYLVFAYWDKLAAMPRTSNCSLTRSKGPQSDEITRFLGEGILPTEPTK